MLWAKPHRFIAALPAPLILLIGLTLIRGLIYLSIFPPFLAPDESAHFEASRLIGQENKWPTVEVYQATPMHPEMDRVFDRFRIWILIGGYSPVKNLGITDNLFIHYYPTQIAGSEVVADSYLMFYHLSVAPISRITTSFDLATQVYFLRFVSVLLAALTVAVAWFTVRIIFPQSQIFALGVCTFIVFWPMHSHVTASINSDTLAELIGAFFFLVVVRIWWKGFSVPRGVMLVCLLGIGMLTKPTAFFLFPTLVAVLIIYIGRRFNWTRMTVGILISILVVFTWVGSVFFYENSGGGRKIFVLFSEGIRFPHWSDYVTSESFFFYVRSLNFAVVSFAGLFGWSNIHIPWEWVRIWALLLFLVTMGILIFITKNLLGIGRTKEKLTNFQREILVIFLIAIVFSLIGVTTPIIVTQSPSWGIHSRYYFPAIVPIALFLFLGVRQLAPARFRVFLWPGWLIGWVLYDAVVFILILVPFLYS
jgi:hypothetical protein